MHLKDETCFLSRLGYAKKHDSGVNEKNQEHQKAGKKGKKITSLCQMFVMLLFFFEIQNVLKQVYCIMSWLINNRSINWWFFLLIFVLLFCRQVLVKWDLFVKRLGIDVQDNV